MTNQITIKQTPLSEAIKIYSVIGEFETNFDQQTIEGRIKDSEKLIIVAYLENQPAGYILAYDRYKNGSFYCWMAAVSSDFRQRGVLKAMMNYLFEWAGKKGYQKISIKTRNKRREMLSYLVKYGFMFTQVTSKPDILEYRIFLEKPIKEELILDD